MQEKTLSLLFLRKDDEILLAMKKRGFGEGRWNGVGGKIEGNESVEESMIRETKEEIGVTPKTYKKVARLEFEEHFKGELTKMHVHVYVATGWEGEPTESEEMAPQWFSIEKIPYSSMWPDDQFWLPQVLEGSLVEAEFTLDESDKIVSYNTKIVEGLK